MPTVFDPATHALANGRWREVLLDGGWVGGHGARVKVAANTVVSIEYTLRDEAGEVLDQSKGEPLAYLHGHGNIVPGLEKALEGLEAGAETKALVAPEDGYGEHSDKKVMQIKRAQLSDEMEPQVGMMLHAETPEGPVPLWITKVEGDEVTVDGNHPLAGKPLAFEVKVVEVRAAAEEELSHGHVHGVGGHAH